VSDPGRGFFPTPAGTPGILTQPVGFLPAGGPRPRPAETGESRSKAHRFKELQRRSGSAPKLVRTVLKKMTEGNLATKENP
jgi:hypothetical protein